MIGLGVGIPQPIIPVGGGGGIESQRASLSLDGDADYAQASDNVIYDAITSAITIEAWVKFIDRGVSYGTSFRTVLSKGTHSGQDFGLVVSGFSSPDNILLFAGGDRITYSPGTAIPADTWFHIAGTWKAGGRAQIHVDGAEVHDEAVVGSSIASTAVPFYIGWDGGSDRYFPGLIDEVRIWNVERTQTEINGNKDSQLAGDEEGLISYYPMNAEDGALIDVTGGNNASLQGAATRVTDTPF